MTMGGSYLHDAFMTKRGRKKKIHRYGRGYGQKKESLSLAWHISEIKKKEKNTQRERRKKTRQNMTRKISVS